MTADPEPLEEDDDNWWEEFVPEWLLDDEFWRESYDEEEDEIEPEDWDYLMWGPQDRISWGYGGDF